MAGLAAVAAETSFIFATSFVEGEWAFGTSSAIQIHVDMLGRGGWLKRSGKWKGWLFGGKGGT